MSSCGQLQKLVFRFKCKMGRRRQDSRSGG